MRKKLSYFFLILFVLPSSFYANSNLTDFQFHIDSLRFITSYKNNLAVIFDSSVTFFDQKGSIVEKIGEIKSAFNKSLSYKYFEIIKNSSGENFYVRKDLGEVFNFKHNSFHRLDKSSHIKIAKGSFKIFHNEHLLNFFGRDQYHSSNFVLDFNLNTREWNKIIPSDNSEIPPARENAFYKKIGDTVHYFGGTLTDNINKIPRFLKDYYIYTLTDKKHVKVGELSFENVRNSTNGRVIELDDYRSLFINRVHMILVNFKNLNFEMKSINSIIGLNPSETNSTNFLKFKNKIYYLNNKNLTGVVNLESIETSNLIDQFQSPRPLLLDKKIGSGFESKLKCFLVCLIAGIIVFFFCFRLFKLNGYKRKNILKQSNYLTYDNVILPLSFEESCIMDFLIANLKVKLADIFELDCFNEYSYSYRKIYIPKLLNNLDDKFKILNQDDNNLLSLVKTKNKFDKRILEIKLKGQISNYSGWLSYMFKIQ
jgi:hypothetical protein